MTSLLDDMVDAHARWNAARLADWYPHEQRRARSREAMQGQAGWVADGAFGLAFRDNVGSVPVADPLAWADRRIDLPDGHWCVSGIRFRGLDATKPFIDVVVTSLPPQADALARLSEVIVPQYSEFAPRAVRVDAPAPDELVAAAVAVPRFAHAAVDQYTVAGLRTGGPGSATRSHGSPLCQEAAGRVVLGLVVAGPGSGLSEVPVWGCEPVALESESSPRCPPGPVVICRAASASIVRKTMSDRRRLRQRMASLEVLPRALVRSK